MGRVLRLRARRALALHLGDPRPVVLGGHPMTIEEVLVWVPNPDRSPMATAEVGVLRWQIIDFASRGDLPVTWHARSKIYWKTP